MKIFDNVYLASDTAMESPIRLFFHNLIRHFENYFIGITFDILYSIQIDVYAFNKISWNGCMSIGDAYYHRGT